MQSFNTDYNLKGLTYGTYQILIVYFNRNTNMSLYRFGRKAILSCPRGWENDARYS